MRALWGITLAASVCVATNISLAQPPDGPPRGPGDRHERDGRSLEGFLSRLLRFDGNKDEKLTKEELVDPRLAALFERADADKDGVVTKEELTVIFKEESVEPGPRRGGPPRGDFGPGGPPDDGPGRRGGRDRRPPPPPEDIDFRDGPPGRRGHFNFRDAPHGEGDDGPRERGPNDRPRRAGRDGERGGPPPMPFPPPRPGDILPHFLQDELDLSEEQRKSLGELQKEVDSKLAEILTNDQKEQLKEIQRRRPGGPGGPRGPGGPPPGEDGPEPRHRDRRP
ncbi:MAG: hypothetical protein U1D30_10020 [Planctomycetota bacterium]